LTGNSGRVDTITANRERWLATMMDDELHLQPVGRAEILCSSVLILVATLVGHLIPLVPFLWLPRSSAIAVAIMLSALVLFGVGVYSALQVGTARIIAPHPRL
jgi:VIT1/CCC1 family predicted Fe2+/Mn2+ transporter